MPRRFSLMLRRHAAATLDADAAAAADATGRPAYFAMLRATPLFFMPLRFFIRSHAVLHYFVIAADAHLLMPRRHDATTAAHNITFRYDADYAMPALATMLLPPLSLDAAATLAFAMLRLLLPLLPPPYAAATMLLIFATILLRYADIRYLSSRARRHTPPACCRCLMLTLRHDAATMPLDFIAATPCRVDAAAVITLILSRLRFIR